ncbi:MAG TPA: ubiquitin-like domain-containing protein, partial [Anaerolineales bacterium]|nr:ubiquitin-like domain-containing protein [Anaerolineales bacterium]
MKLDRWLALALTFFLFACQPAPPPTNTIIVDGETFTLQSDARIPSALLAEAGITLNPNDRVLS